MGVVMQPKQLLKTAVRNAAGIPALRSWMISGHEVFSAVRTKMFGTRNGWERRHPFDAQHGVRTSGRVPDYLLGAEVSPEGNDVQPDANFGRFTTVYAGVQPSVFRQAMAVIPQPWSCHFLDLGCGKGRGLLLATEFNFAQITGVELSPDLAQIARRNVAAYLKNQPASMPIEVIAGDAVVRPLPPEPLVIFLYHPFGRPLMTRTLCATSNNRCAITHAHFTWYIATQSAPQSGDEFGRAGTSFCCRASLRSKRDRVRPRRIGCCYNLAKSRQSAPASRQQLPGHRHRSGSGVASGDTGMKRSLHALALRHTVPGRKIISDQTSVSLSRGS